MLSVRAQEGGRVTTTDNTDRLNGYPEIMTSGEVAEVFGVKPITVTRWDRKGILVAIRTPGNHRRFRKEDVAELLRKE